MPRIENTRVYGLEEAIKTAKYAMAVDTDNLTSELTKGIKNCFTCRTGEGHDSALKGIIVQFDLVFSEAAWRQSDRYHFFEFVSSTSKMHKLTQMPVREQCNQYVDDRNINVLEEYITKYNRLVEAKKNNEATQEQVDESFLYCIYNVPMGFELKAGMSTNYLQLKTMYQQRKHHRLPDWQMFCRWCESLPRFIELTQKEKIKPTVLSYDGKLCPNIGGTISFSYDPSRIFPNTKWMEVNNIDNLWERIE